MNTDLDLRSADGTPLAARYWPAAARAAGVVVVRGLHGRDENHADFARVCRAAGLAALTPDLRGHAASGGEFGPGAIDDVIAAVEALGARGHARVGLRGSSLDGFLALAAAARSRRVACVVAICPARPLALAERLGAEWPTRFPPADAIGTPDGVARGHAIGDAQVPWAATWALAQATPQPRYLRTVLGGSHSSLQHNDAIRRETCDFLCRHLA